MKFAILGDVHANLEALTEVLKDCEKEEITDYVCVGDIVGYGPNPKECLALVHNRLKMSTVKGNHDELCSNKGLLTGFNPFAAAAVEWTRLQLSDEDKKWLANLQYTKQIESFTVVHATLDTPQRWGYVFDRFSAASSFSYQSTALCFCGHTHVPLAFIRDAAVRGGQYTRLRIEAGKKYFVNVGSVGQPRDGNPKAAYVVYDSEDDILTLKRVEYDIAAVQKKILDAGLPKRLAERLDVGR